MTQGTNNIWKAGKIINAGDGANEFVSLIRPNTSSTSPQSPNTDAYAIATRPSHVISQGDRPNNPLISGNPLQKIRNS